ncbi:MAG: HIRAN domain-containing protein [Solirubrobacteraceae bacterium]
MRAIELPAGQTVAIVGEATFQPTIARACGPIRAERVHCAITAALVPEPENRYDPNAVAVYIGGEKVGYLSRRDALDYQPAMQALRAAGYQAGVCRGCIAGQGPGSEKLNLGVYLYLAGPEELLDALS